MTKDEMTITCVAIISMTIIWLSMLGAILWTAKW